MFRRLNHHPSITEKQFSLTPPLVDAEHLQINNKLLSDDTITATIHWFEEEANQHVNRRKVSEHGREWYVLKLRHRMDLTSHYYALYLGQHVKPEAGKSYSSTGKLLGLGGFGKIRLLQDLMDGRWYALKILKYTLDVNNTFDTSEDDVTREVTNLDLLGMNFGWFKRAAKSHTPNKRYEKISIVMPYFLGESLDHMVREKIPVHMHPIKVLDLIIQLLKQLESIQEIGYVHSDIKLNNILFDRLRGNLQLIDFGGMFKNNKIAERLTIPSYGYQPPELSHTYDEKSEVFSAAIIIGKLLGFTGEHIKDYVDDESNIFRHHKLRKLENIGSKHRTAIIDKRIRADIYHYMQTMLAFSPTDRPTFTQAHQYFANVQTQFPDVLLLVRKVGLLNVDEYLRVKTNLQQYKNLLILLKAMDLVWLVDVNQQYRHQYTQIGNELNKLDIKMGDKVFSSTKKEVTDRHLLRHISFNSSNTEAYFYFTATVLSDILVASLRERRICVLLVETNFVELDKAAAIQQHVRDTKLLPIQLFFVQHALQSKIIKLKTKYPNCTVAQAKIDLIKEKLHLLNETHQQAKLSFDYLHQTLQDLEPVVLSTAQALSHVIKEQHSAYYP